jgi:hypothetical protein
MTIIAYNGMGEITSIVSAKSKELAQVYFQGAGIDAHTVKSVEEDFPSLSEHPTGVMPLLKTEVKELKSWSMADYKKFVVVTK